MHGCSHYKKLLSAAGLGACCVILMLALVAESAWAQGQELIEVVHPGGLTKFSIGRPTVVTLGETTLTYWARPTGRFQLSTGPTAPVGGDPTRSGDENKVLVGRAYTGTNGFLAYTGAIQFSIDQTADEATTDGVLVDLFSVMTNTAASSSAAAVPNYWPVPLAETTRGATGTALVPLDGKDLTKGSIEAYHNFQLVGDVLMIEIVITNTDLNSHKVGLRLAFDAGFGGTGTLDGAPIFLSTGLVADTERVFPDPLQPSATLPASWTSYDDPNNPLVSVKGVLDNPEVHDSGMANSSAGAPDALEFGLWNHIGGSGMNFRPNNSISLLGENWGAAVKWNERELPPSISRRYVTYIGFGAAQADYMKPFATMAYGPLQLIAQTSASGLPSLTDPLGRSPFPVSVYADNFGSETIQSATASINPPDGLVLSPADQSRTLSLGTLPRNLLAGGTWTLDPVNARPGIVTIGLSGPRGRPVNRKLQIPAIPVLIPRATSNGLDMISLPYNFINTDAEHVFESLGGLQPGQNGSLVRWDPAALVYRWFPHPFVTNISPGIGYWVLNRASNTIVLPGDATPLPSDASVNVELPRGWNQIGDPFTLPVRFDSLQVITPTSGQIGIAEAISQGLLQATLFAYDPDTQNYTWETNVSNLVMDPYAGYWLLTYQPLTLVIPPPLSVSVASAPHQVVSPAADGWRTELVVSGPGLNAPRTLGLATTAQDGLDRHDIVAPPMPLTAAANVTFVSPQNTPGCVVDVKAADRSEKTWRLQVTCQQPQTGLTLSWPDLSTMPSDLVPVLEDVATGARCYMRTTARYQFDMPAAGTRMFKITVSPKSGLTPMISGVQAQATASGGVAVTYVLSAPATVDLQIRNLAGVVIKRLSAGPVTASGTHTLVWDGRSDSGSRAPSGRYLCELAARAQSGEASSIITTFEVRR